MAYFQNDIKEISLGYRRYAFSELSIAIDFNLNRDFSELRVLRSDQPSRETTEGIANEIMRRINNYKTLNHFFHPTIVVGFLVVVASLYAIIFLTTYAIRLFLVGRAGLGTSYASGASLFLVYGLLSIAKPYTVFHTRKNESNARWTSWLLWGALSFLLFSVGLAYVRKELLGF